MRAKIDSYLTPHVQEAIRNEITTADGNEVFFVGLTDDEHVVVEVKAMARGNHSQVAAHTEHTEPGSVIIHNHPGDDLRPSDADVDLSAFFASMGVGSYIVNNAVTAVYALVEPYTRKEHKKLLPDEITNVFIEGGLISAALTSYEFRPEQLNMAHHICESFNNSGIYLIEAGTGTGKTFAYLVPAILYAILNKKRVVVSTNTINLQEQLLHKDIPFLQKALGKEFRVTLVKGRGNYLCKRKLRVEIEQFEIFPDDDIKTFDLLYTWSQKTRDGSLSDLNFVPEREIWDKVCSEGDNCLRIKCPFYKECFFHTARQDAAISEIVLVNHHILFADLALKLEIGDTSDYLLLPPFKSVIIDEAHNIEDAATSYFSRRLSRYGVRRILKRLYNIRGRKKKGFLLFLEQRIQRKERTVRNHIDELKKVIVHVSVAMEDIFESFSEFFSVYFKLHAERKDFITLTPELINSIEYRDVVADNITALRGLLEELLEKIKILVKSVEKAKYRNPQNRPTDCTTLNSMASKLTDLIFLTNLFLSYEHDDLVRWIECRKQKGGGLETFFKSAPVEIEEMLQKTLFSECTNVILTSATLSVEGNLNFMKDRLGLGKKQRTENSTVMQCAEFMLPSSFDYKRQVFLGIFEHMPAPTERGFEVELKKNIYKALSLTGGKAFVLFTSYYLLNKMADELHSPLTVCGINLLKQGDITRHKLLNAFRDDVSSVLFGTDSFWEGVDVEGESLSNVLITRLPFQVPNDPIIEARSERIKKRGGNPFMEYTVPQAVIKFKQGFGRLIRSKNDFGSVLICDSRVINKQYGLKFLNSLPECTITFGADGTVFAGLRRFYEDFKHMINDD